LQHIGRADWIGLWKLYDHEQSAGTLDQSAHGNTGLGTSWRPVPCAIRPPVERRCSFRWFRVARGAYGPWD
jgi:hypothetical protein